ncbi:hypothetical protein Acsp03_14010 [Actinomadura sp. NBRC 104412]|uniref:CDP-alcohol phosphatidyltransferase family protein n=1 Tax=Actinomadura sp. NBRC 104412 TaxID=3032203 RepID=UPI0024A4CE2C|nr:CDP-alcohol phosphatidyltransferase family protein [Actinomadura sp. NBRC 104412]GLZ03935.1 hypothetical protein Acsp03_14010 [Actinomadura sp. NBRC 104412]
MTVAVILATGRALGAPGTDPPAHLARLRDLLATVNVPDVHVIGRPGAGVASGAVVAPGAGAGSAIVSPDVAGDLRRIAQLARRADVPVVILPADLLVSAGLLDRFVNGTAAPLAAVTVPPGEAGQSGTASARVRRGRVVQVGLVPKVNAAFPGVLRFDVSEGRAIAELAESLADLAGPGTEGDAAGLLLAGLVRLGRPVASHPARAAKGGVCRRIAADEPGGAALREARVALEAADARYEDDRRLAAAVKSDDGFFSTFAVSSYSPRLVRWLAGREVTPTTVTAVSVVFALLAALWFSAGTRPGMVTGAVLLYLAFVLDVADGQLARYTGRRTEFGARLDMICGHGKEYVVYLGLAFGSAEAAGGGGDAWALAVAVLILQAVRDVIDASYEARTRPPHVPLQRTPVNLERAFVANLERALIARPDGRLSRSRALYWARKAWALPVGERVALVALTAALFDARVTFLALLTWGVIATVITLAGRIRQVSASRTA